MVRISILAVAVAASTMLAGAAQAAERCNEPYAPTIKLGAAATKQDLATLRGDASAFLAASDLYQKCLVAKGATQDQLHANQTLKQKVGFEYNAALQAFRAAHPGA